VHSDSSHGLAYRVTPLETIRLIARIAAYSALSVGRFAASMSWLGLAGTPWPESDAWASARYLSSPNSLFSEEGHFRIISCRNPSLFFSQRSPREGVSGQ